MRDNFNNINNINNIGFREIPKQILIIPWGETRPNNSAGEETRSELLGRPTPGEPPPPKPILLILVEGLHREM